LRSFTQLKWWSLPRIDNSNGHVRKFSLISSAAKQKYIKFPRGMLGGESNLPTGGGSGCEICREMHAKKLKTCNDVIALES
jgi:hypothetical protein